MSKSESKEAGALQGKLCLVTGANSGIGKATAFGLARMGATVILACRNAERAEAARQNITSQSRNQGVSVALVDLSSLDSVRSFANAFQQKHSRLDVLVNNAGIYSRKLVLTEDGFESAFQINHLGHFLLTNLLLERLKAGAPSRIVNVTSAAHWAGHINFKDLSDRRPHKGWSAYSESKLANVLFTYELARRLEGVGVTANCVHPGTVRTNFARNNGGIIGLGVKLIGPFMLSPEEGARTVIWLASAPELEQVTGKYFEKQSEKRSSRESYDLEVARRLWDVSSELVGLIHT